MWMTLEKALPQGWGYRLHRIAFSLWGSAAFVAVIFTLRGLAGAFQHEISPLAASVSAFLAGLVCLAGMVCYRAGHANGFTRKQTYLATTLTVLPTTLLGVVLCPASSALGMGWVTILGIGLCIGGQMLAKPKETSALLEATSPPKTMPIITSAFPKTLEEPDLTQWMTRRAIVQDGEHWEQIEGLATVEFAAGQQHATVHVSICPPLSSLPEIECETQGDADVEWKVAAVHPYGVRLELRRPAPLALPLTVSVGYTMAALVQTILAKAA